MIRFDGKEGALYILDYLVKSKESIKMCYKLIVSDIDGTLLNNEKRLLPQTERTIRYLVSSGYLFATASVRTKSFTMKPIKSLMDICCGNIYLSGTLVENSDGAVISNNPLKQDEVSQLMKKCIRHELSFCCVSQSTAIAKVFRKNVEVPFKSYHGEYDEKSVIDPYKICTYCFVVVANNTKTIVDYAIGKGFDLEASPIYLDPATSLEEIFFLKKGINKGSALRCLSMYYGVDLSNTIAIGDDPWVDGPMIEIAGCGVAMKNAPPSLHTIANYTTEKDNNEDGIGEFLRNHIF